MEITEKIVYAVLILCLIARIWYLQDKNKKIERELFRKCSQYYTMKNILKQYLPLNDKMTDDLMNFGLAILREKDGKIDYIDPLSRETEKLLKLKNNVMDNFLKQVFNAAREGKTIGGIGGYKEHKYETFEDWYDKHKISISKQ